MDAIFDDIEVESDGLLEVYIRMNADIEKDYCFVISVNDTFEDLYKIFDTLPLALRPSVFYKMKPKGFLVSSAPGYLTEDGALLFSYDSDSKQWTKKVKQDAKISDNVWPGQLIIPEWEANNFNFVAIIMLLLGWLYTDLPDFISPTPGICLTSQLSRVLSYLAENVLQNQKLAEDLYKEYTTPASLSAQILFFTVHLAKIGILFMLLQSGGFNPYEMRIPFVKEPKSISQITKEELIQIGWTGSKRATLDEYKDFYREFKIQEAGGLVKASRAGVLKRLNPTGCFLGKGEGFDTPIGSVSTLSELKEQKEFRISYEYLALIGSLFEKSLSGTTDINKSIKDFRRFGLLFSNDEITAIVNKRKALGDGDIEKVVELKKEI